MSKPVTGSMIAQVGTISANHDETIGRSIAEAMEKAGKDGVITVEEARSMEWARDKQVATRPGNQSRPAIRATWLRQARTPVAG
jgi:hypothetical protein